jgi:uncharacterized protein (DUF433 family)
MLATAWPFIEIDDQGRPRIKGTRIKVLLLIKQYLAWSWDAEEMQRNYPQLSLAQVHAVLGYYYEHQAQCDQLMAEGEQFIEATRAQQEDADLQARLRQSKAEP